MDQVYKPQSLITASIVSTPSYTKISQTKFGGRGHLLTFETYNAGEFRIVPSWPKKVHPTVQKIFTSTKGNKMLEILR
jgi:hypothetical protein